MLHASQSTCLSICALVSFGGQIVSFTSSMTRLFIFKSSSLEIVCYPELFLPVPLKLFCAGLSPHRSSN